MKVVNKKMCVILVLLLVIIESCTLFLMYKSYSAKKTNLDEVSLQENLNNMFAIMLEQDDGTYKEDTSNTWPPSGYTYNASMSGCIDLNGNKLDGVLTYDSANNIATIDTGKTSYCYLYFSIPKWCEENETASECLLRNPTSGLNTSIEAGMYRYQGNSNNNDVVNNYICFGTADKSTCTSDTEVYMYRVMGITENGQVKLIKKETLNDVIDWYHDGENPQDDNIEWPSSNAYETINGNGYLLNDTYVPAGWGSKIATTNWKYGDTTSNGNYDGATMYSIENGWKNEVSAKVGLMYIHDYYYAYASGGAQGTGSNAQKAWIHRQKRDRISEMVISRYGFRSLTLSYLHWRLGSSGSLASGGGNSYVRPVFYLTSDVEIISGTGTIDDPFLIS